MNHCTRQIYSLGLTQEAVYAGETSNIVPYHRMYGKAYCLPSVSLYTSEEIAELSFASKSMDAIFRKTLRFVQRYMPDHYLTHQLGIPPSLLPLVREEIPLSGITRQDWILGPQGLKIIEINADTPTGIPESAYLEGQIVQKHTSWEGPSGNLANLLAEELLGFTNYYKKSGLKPSVTFSCYDWHQEDRFNTFYLMEQLRRMGVTVHYAPLEELEIIPGKGLYHNGRQIDIWYRLYPLEYLTEDRDETSGIQVGIALLELVAQGKIGLINPAQNFIMQSKGFLATLWSLYERNHQTFEYCGFTLFEPEELAMISTYCLPTYFTAEPFELKDIPYAAKSYWGREGKGTSLHGSEDPYSMKNNPELEEDEELIAYYNNQPKIYQQYWTMPLAQVNTEKGTYNGHLLTGAFVVGGQFGGVLSRIGDKVTGDGAYYCPAAIIPAEQ
ncbi:glutathionylspermidine synthase family protein [Paenibacillus sp. GCM10028914]|uniref:glutathionylspermidine synthase family protein n=1 Tax=Paenibacillus sp. GCM10028914 TaxID=3273416 RepID=UPI00360AB5F5